jgi:hypothetical protein
LSFRGQPASASTVGLARTLGVMNSPTAWNLDQLRKHVRATHAEPDPVLELIFSIDRSTRIFRYHMATARDAMKGIVNETDSGDTDTLLLVFGTSEKQGDFEYAKVVSEAHFIGCLHTARGLWDLFAQLMNALVLTAPLPVAACDIHRVAAALPQSHLKTKVDALLASHWYRYVQSYINTTKHRRLVQHLISVSWAENRAGIKFGAFTYGNQSFKEYWGTEVLEGAIEVKNSIIACGRLLNSELGA